MSYTLAEAAVAIGRDRSTLLRAIKHGKLTATRDEATGAWRVDAAELARVYDIGSPTSATQADAELRIGSAAPDMRLLLEVECTKTAGLEARLADTDRVVDDLRRRLDTATAQLGEALAQVRLLTDQRSSPARRSWLPWRRR